MKKKKENQPHQMQNNFHDSSLFDYLGSWLKFQIERFNIPGLSASILLDRKINDYALGYANVARKEVMTTRHLFRISSQSKTFTAIAIMQLVERGLLQLDDKINQYFPEIKNGCGRNVTIRQILSHSAGLIFHAANSDFWQLGIEFPTQKELLDHLADRFVTQNGKQYKYSNFGYALLGSLIERITKQTYEVYVQENILDKLGLTISPNYRLSYRPYVSGYSGTIPFGQRMELPYHSDTYAFSSAIGYISNPHDLCQFYQKMFLENSPLLSTKRKKEMCCVQSIQSKRSKGGSGFGLMIERLKDKKTNLIGHTGTFIGQNSATFFDPNEKMVISVAVNVDERFAECLAKGLYRIICFFQNVFPAHESSKTRNLYKKFCGRFYSLNSVIDIIPARQKIYIVQPGDPESFVKPTLLAHRKNHTFKVIQSHNGRYDGEEVVFELNSKEKIKRVVFAGMSYFDRKTCLKKFQSF